MTEDDCYDYLMRIRENLQSALHLLFDDQEKIAIYNLGRIIENIDIELSKFE